MSNFNIPWKQQADTETGERITCNLNKENKMFTVTIYNKSNEQTWQGTYDTFQEANHAALPLMSDPIYVGCTIVVADAKTGERICNWKNTCTLLTVWDYEQAINSQSACNATGLINSLNDLREKLWNVARQYGHGTEWVNHHPILQLYAYQLAHLCHGREPIEWEGYHKAYLFCKLVKYGKLTPDHDYTLNDWDENTLGFPQYLK